MENRSFQDEERANQIELQLKEASTLAEEADRKYDEVARKLAMVEADLERAEERAEAGENKIVELEEELRVVGNNLKSLEVSEEKALQREESYEDQIRTSTTRRTFGSKIAKRSRQAGRRPCTRKRKIQSNLGRVGPDLPGIIRLLIYRFFAGLFWSGLVSN